MKLKLFSLLLLLCAQGATAKVFIVVEENHSFEQVMGNSGMPYLNALATSYGFETEYYGTTQPSIGNYFALTTGYIITNDDSYGAEVTQDNIVRHLIAAGRTWKEYSESIPYEGYFGPDSGSYTQHHNPCSYFSDVRNDAAQSKNLVSTTQLAVDISNDALPDWGLIVPNNAHNSHDGTLAAADQWLQSNIAPLVAHLNCGDVLVIVYDESVSMDTANGGGHVAWIVVGPAVKRHYQSSNYRRHASTLRFTCDLLGISDPFRYGEQMYDFLQ
jgi:acid phosphatase